jgi:spore coat polysaccharide biosynthesis protein SpsF (cytidylyltransferase family)
VIVALIQVRYGSTRLPGKILMDVGGQPMLLRVVETARQIKGVDLVACALAAEPETPRVTNLLQTHGVPFMVGQCATADVLTRFDQAASHFGAGTIVRVTPDCPLLSAGLASLVLELSQRAQAEYASNVGPWTDGTDVEVFSRAALAAAHAHATSPEDRDHVTPWMRRDPYLRRVHLETVWFSEKMSVDTADDLARVRLQVGLGR